MKPLELILRRFLDLHPEDAANTFEALDSDSAIRLLKTFPANVGGELLERLNVTVSARILQQMEERQISELLAHVSPRQASSILSYMDESIREPVLAGMPDREASMMRELSSYPPETAGAIMEPRVASLSIDLTAQQAISTIRKAPREALHYLYVVSRQGELVGVVNMRDLLLASPRDPIRKFVNPNVISVPATMDQEEVVNKMRQGRFLALPVLDFHGRLVGVVKHNEALQAGQEEAFEDMQKAVGAGADERALSSVATVVRSRLPWLYVNLGTAFLASAVIGLFEGVIAQVAALAVLLPVVAGQGGNTGSQSLAIVMRGIALREIVPGVKKRVVVKETLAGLCNGLAVALAAGVGVVTWRLTAGDDVTVAASLAAVISLAMVVNMVTAASAGAVIPLLLKALGRDPAQSASIFLTTVTDIVGFGAFLGIAAAFMPLLR